MIFRGGSDLVDLSWITLIVRGLLGLSNHGARSFLRHGFIIT